MKKLVYSLLAIFILLPELLVAQASIVKTQPDSIKLEGDSTNTPEGDGITFSGQLSGWMMVLPDNDMPLWAGARYIPQLNYRVDLPSKRLLDFELAANLSANIGSKPFIKSETDGAIKPYRAWARYSNESFELRAGLQKISFGSASLIRPLMWFDRTDPRDPLQMTDGVWGLLARYYFMNNTNIWLWGLYGNKRPSAWDLLVTKSTIPEYGGRIQLPVFGGEGGFSYHHRAVTNSLVSGIVIDSLINKSNIPENRFGIDGKWDLGAGVWFEASWTNKQITLFEYLSNQHLVNLGADYTFGIGNGLNVIIEHLLVSQDKTAFEFRQPVNFSVTSVSYPIGLFDNISAIIYYDWRNQSLYNFIRWKKDLSRFTIYGMIFWNPDKGVLPMTNDQRNLLAGKGVQVMVVFNH